MMHYNDRLLPAVRQERLHHFEVGFRLVLCCRVAATDSVLPIGATVTVALPVLRGLAYLLQGLFGGVVERYPNADVNLVHGPNVVEEVGGPEPRVCLAHEV